MEKIAKLKTLTAAIETDAAKFFEKGNSAAGTRARKSLQELKVLAQEIRMAISSQKKLK